MQRELHWRPSRSVKITPEEYELQIVDWLRASGQGLVDFKVQHLEKLTGASGEYSIDAVARFQVLAGAEITILVECKRLKRPVEREVLLVLSEKLKETGAHKGMVISTSGFQSGAIEYATKRGMAAITLNDGKYTYETRNAETEPVSNLSPGIPRFAGFMLCQNEGSTTISISTVSTEYVDALANWIQS